MRDCYARAKACARKAEDALTEEAWLDFLGLEQSWLALARSYQLPPVTRSAQPLIERRFPPPWSVVEYPLSLCKF